MLYAKLSAIAVIAFGFALVLIFQFSWREKTPDPEPDWTSTWLSKQEIGAEMIRLTDVDSEMLVFAHPKPVIRSECGEILEWIIDDGHSPMDASQLEAIDWIMMVASVPKIESETLPRRSVTGWISQLDHLVGAVRFEKQVSDESVLAWFEQAKPFAFEQSEHRGRLFLENRNGESISVWRLDAATFLFGRAEVLKAQNSRLRSTSRLDSWINRFQTEPIYDDFVIVADLSPLKRELAKSFQWSVLNLINNATVATVEINFAKEWFMICRLDTFSEEAAYEMRKMLRLVWHSAIGNLMEKIRGDESSEVEKQVQREMLKIVKTLVISRKDKQIVVGMPEPKNLSHWIDQFFESLNQSESAKAIY